MNIDDVKKYIKNRASDHMDEKCCSQADVDRSVKERDEVLKWVDDVNTSAGRGDVTVSVVTIDQLNFIFSCAQKIRESKVDYNHDAEDYLRTIVENNRVEAVDILNMVKHLKGER